MEERNEQMADQTQLTPEEVEEIKKMRQSRIQRARTIVSSVDPWLLVGVGAGTLGLWLICSITQIRTSEALMLGGVKVPVEVAWGVLMQPYQLLTGTAPLNVVMAWSYGWCIEFLTLIWALALEHARVRLHEANKHLGKWYGLVTALLIGLNSWADYNNSPGNDPLSQALIAGAVGIMVVTGLPVGLALLKAGLAKMGE
jgi:hypothetical protein